MFDFDIDTSRWMFGIEWYKELGWIKVSFAVFTLTFWWKERPYKLSPYDNGRVQGLRSKEEGSWN